MFHNEGKSRYSRTKIPWKLIFVRPFEMKSEALKFERYLKSTRNKDFIKRNYKEFFLRDVAQSG